MKEYRLSSDDNLITLMRLEFLVETIPAQLRQYTAEEFSRVPAPGKWSRKQIIGHLIDSATNNHRRFVCAQYEEFPQILYDQEAWNAFGYYQDMEGEDVIHFWEAYNRFLLQLVKRIPPSNLERECTMEDGSTRSIAWLFDDYVRHLEHHLEQL